jgi:hypothetical protein
MMPGHFVRLVYAMAGHGIAVRTPPQAPSAHLRSASAITGP